MSNLCLKSLWLRLVLIAIPVLVSRPLNAQNASTEPVKDKRVVSRIFWQDYASQSIRWGDLIREGDLWSLKPLDLEGFPKIDLERQNLVQMDSHQETILVGVHDDDRGNLQSGWIAIDSGVEFEEHGDHFHQHYRKSPKVVFQKLDKSQGNPAHVYRYGNQFVVANDAKNGFTVVDPVALKTNPAKGARFYSGGGNHITLALFHSSVVYATWADREGDNAGRVDVVGVGSQSHKKAYAFRLASGGLHGATENSGRIFFAPADGIDAVRADADLASPSGKEAIEHLDLGSDPVNKRPFRTGAFTNHRNWVLFSYGSDSNSKLGMIDASEPKLRLRELALPTEKGLALITPKAIRTRSNKDYALVIHDRRQSEAQEILKIIDLDPNADQNFSDAKAVSSLNLGPSKVEGHSGHHEIAFLPQRTMACISNPGDGSIWLISLNDGSVLNRFPVGGIPGRLLIQ